MKHLIAAASLAVACVAGTANAERLVVGVENIEYLPHYNWDGTNYTGFGADLLSAFAADEGFEIEFKALPITRLMQAVVTGDVDLKYPDNAYWSSELKDGQGMVYSEVVAEAIDGVMVLPDQVGRPVEEVERLGTVLGFTPYSWLDRINAGDADLTENASFIGMVRQALVGRIDGAYANQDVVRRVLRELGKDEDALVFDESLPHSVSNYHLSSTSRPDVVEAFNVWLAANGDTVAALREKHAF
ncbi:transporter substrate-binding domain-containing protein [uncultured Shimia sp.]|uniref:substrate-binding periplasmic protein n=1 Tax=uncultured Shimia sp. TaxID=573152 RepID=UPI0025E6D0C7|nr:transporter substrate-binding domain-containing protein [uncultured Shimia sp.]